MIKNECIREKLGVARRIKDGGMSPCAVWQCEEKTFTSPSKKSRSKGAKLKCPIVRGRGDQEELGETFKKRLGSKWPY